MSADPRIERVLPGILADLGAGAAPDYADLLLARTARTRQRPAWVFPERWLPMDLAVRRVRILTPPRRLLAVTVLLLIAAIVAVLIVAGGPKTRLPAPFGLAGNGLIVFADLRGQLQLGDPVTMTSRVIVATGRNSRPVFSPDGTRLAFLQERGDGHDVVISRFDGTAPVVLTTEPLGQVTYFEWLPDSNHVIAVTATSGQVVYDVTRPGTPPAALPYPVPADDHNNVMGWIHRPPDGAEVAMIRSEGPDIVIVIAGRDGQNQRTIVDPTKLDYGDIMRSPAWSPDGSKLLFAAGTAGEADYRAYVVNADGTDLHLLTRDTRAVDEEVVGVWSPDGSSVVLQRWYMDGLGSDPRPLTVVDVASGSFREVGPRNVNGYTSYGWSPDGSRIIEVPGGDSRVVILVDPITGTSTQMDWYVASSASWQRVTPAAPGG